MLLKLGFLPSKIRHSVKFLWGNYLESLGELHKAAETLTCGTCPKNISCSPFKFRCFYDNIFVFISQLMRHCLIIFRLSRQCVSGILQAIPTMV